MGMRSGVIAEGPVWEWKIQQQEQDGTSNDILVPCKTLLHIHCTDHWLCVAACSSVK